DAAYRSGPPDLARRRSDVDDYNAKVSDEVGRALAARPAAAGPGALQLAGLFKTTDRTASRAEALNQQALAAYAKGDQPAGDGYARQARDFAEKYLAPALRNREAMLRKDPGARGGVPVLPPAGGVAPAGRAAAEPPSPEAYEADLRA